MIVLQTNCLFTLYNTFLNKNVKHVITEIKSGRWEQFEDAKGLLSEIVL